MNAPDDIRRSLLLGIGGFAMSSALSGHSAVGQPSPHQGGALNPEQGEHLIHFRDGGNIFIKVSAATGSERYAIGTQQITVGAGVPVHRHFEMEESFYVLEGSGFFILQDVRHAIQQGSTIFIPKNHWHGFANPDHELLLLWIVSPAGLDGFFRETCSPPGAPRKQLTRDQIHQIALKYGTEFK
ncbi:cupin domain-containing protein [Occallatibacter savannae]|uniref:cupin domain-containing protein n=1 Tax=Occallatibacter savannae TaxID=1002691 RepID=UPI000D68D70E|nr:cupin domain-containing protein [Occallatibacter savannae]